MKKEHGKYIENHIESIINQIELCLNDYKQKILSKEDYEYRRNGLVKILKEAVQNIENEELREKYNITVGKILNKLKKNKKKGASKKHKIINNNNQYCFDF